jgi:hypothetical protein
MVHRANVQPQRFSEGSLAARKERELSIPRNLRIVSGIERRNTAFTFVACPSVTHPLNGDLVILCFEQRERERERERKRQRGTERERERREVLKNLSISLINRYLQYLTKKAATFFPLLCFFFFVQSRAGGI